MTSLHRLLPLFERARAAREPVVLATVIRTGGSTYAKPGAQMLIALDGQYAGLLSGGCLEGDLREHARAVIADGAARIVSYDLRSSTDQLFGLGAGCEGAMDILLCRVGPQDDWRPLAAMAESFQHARPQRVAFVTASGNTELPLGTCTVLGTTDGPESVRRLRAAIDDTPHDFTANGPVAVKDPPVEVFVASVPPPPRLVLLGGGPDARPVAELAAFLGWRVTVVDHRASYLAPGLFPAAARLLETRREELPAQLALGEFDAAIVMSHHLDSDLAYLRALAASAVPYVGLLGPAARREKLLGDLGADAASLRPRLRAPVGLDIGGRTPESIALSIVGEVHAALAGREGRPFSETSASGTAARE